MSTTLLYLDDTYLKTAEVTFLRMESTEKGIALELDETIFYPQGGGQPADRGVIETSESSFEVTDVRLDSEGRVWHYGTFKNGQFTVGQKVSLLIDIVRRIQNSKIHSAGHLVDSAIQSIFPPLKAHKGFHFSEGPYIEGNGEFIGDLQIVREQIEKKMKELVDARLAITTRSLSDIDAQSLGFVAPAGKGLRLVEISGFSPVGCGGTHVRSTGEIGIVSIRKVTSKSGVFKVAYEVS